VTKQSVILKRRQTFIPIDFWPPTGLDLNPVDYQTSYIRPCRNVFTKQTSTGLIQFWCNPDGATTLTVRLLTSGVIRRQALFVWKWKTVISSTPLELIHCDRNGLVLCDWLAQMLCNFSKICKKKIFTYSFLSGSAAIQLR